MPLTKLHTVTNYEATLAEFIKKNEGFEPEIYLDSKGIATIGIGYALNKSINIISADFAKAGIPLTETQKTVLDNWYKNNNGKPSQSDVNAFNANANTIILSETQGKNLFIAIKGQYEDIVKSKLGTTLYNSMANTKELIALVDMAYNSPALIGNNLVAAITNGDRVAAWYEIRYNSNRERSYGLQNRRARESDMFGLYSGGANTPSSDNEAKQVIQFLEAKRGAIATYLGQIPSVGISDLDNSLSPAKSRLITNYAKGVNIDGDVIVGQGIGQNGEAYADIAGNINDTLQGTAKNDLIFGEKGDDIIFGNGGNDVLYGGEGQDTLIGGTGYDTYIASNGDKIYDEDGIGHVEFYGMTLSGGTQVEGSPDTYEGNGGVYTLDATNKVLTFTDTKNGNSVQILDFDKNDNDLGITLKDSDGGSEDENPDPKPVTATAYVYAPSVSEGAGLAPFAVKLTNPINSAVTITLETIGGSATPGADFGAGTITVTIPKNGTFAEFSVYINDDDIPEPVETFSVQIIGISVNGIDTVYNGGYQSAEIYDNDGGGGGDTDTDTDTDTNTRVRR